MKKRTSPPVVLTLAGSDSGGGAGIQADIKTMTRLGGFATSVIVALTAQNGAEVRGVHAVPPDFVKLQIAAVLEGFPVRAAKTGMLATREIIETVSRSLKDRAFPLVVDPVCVSQSGYQLLEDNAVDSLRDLLLPLAAIVTPNCPEAALLSGVAINSVEDVREASRILLNMGAKAVLIKGGHFHHDDGIADITDWLAAPGVFKALAHPMVETKNNHGTGCTLSAAIATYLALGHPLEEAVTLSQAFLSRALAASFTPGIGAGPPNFMA